MLTLEEAIKAEEAETLAYEECLNSLDDNMPTDMWNELNKSLGKQMDYHRQLAEWLKELKAYREADKEMRGFTQAWEEGAGIHRCIETINKYIDKVVTIKDLEWRE